MYQVVDTHTHPTNKQTNKRTIEETKQANHTPTNSLYDIMDVHIFGNEPENNNQMNIVCHNRTVNMQVYYIHGRVA